MNQVKIVDSAVLMEQVKQYDIISFDVFDTLLLRPFAAPTDLFFYMEQIMGRPGFAKARISVEQKLRRGMKETEEIHLDEIYSNLPEYQDLMQAELDTEKSLLHPNPDLLCIYQAAQEMGKTIIIVSDIYLPEAFMIDVLRENGYDGYHKIYVSSTWNREKWTGNLFRCVIDDLKVDPGTILHIGDNYNSDIKAANAIGIHTYHVQKVMDCYLKDVPYRKEMAEREWNSSALVMRMAERLCVGYDSYWHRFGYEFAGPVCYGFTRWIYDTVKNEESINDVIFVARDGYLLKEIFDKLSAQVEDLTSHYVYAPRFLNLICRMDYDIEYYDCLSQMNMIIGYYLKKAGKKVVQFTSKEAANQFIQEHFIEIETAFQEDREGYRKYMLQLNLGTGPVAVVDSITDKFSAQKLIESSIQNRVLGLYWCVLDGGIKKNPSMHFFSYQKEHRHILDSWDIMEFIMSSPEPSVRTIEEERPCYNKVNAFEEKRVEIFREISRGVREFVDDLLTSGLKCLVLESDLMIAWANQFFRNPQERDLEAFENIKFSISPDHSDMLPLHPFKGTEITQDTVPFIPHSLKDRLWVYSQRHPALYKILHLGNNFQRSVKHNIKKIYAKVLRFIFRPVINGVIFAEEGSLNDRTRDIKNGMDLIITRICHMEQEMRLHSDFLHLIEAQSQDKTKCDDAIGMQLQELQRVQQEILKILANGQGEENK